MYGEQGGGQPSRQCGCRNASIVRRRNRRTHGLDLPLHEPVDLAQGLLVDRSTDHDVGINQNKWLRIGAGDRDAQRLDQA